MTNAFKARFFMGLMVFSLLAHSNPAMAGPLHDAVRKGDGAAIIEALSNGNSIDETDFFLGSPLHVAVVEQRPKIVDFLIQNGASVDLPSELDAKTALQLAAELGDAGVVSLLLDRSADVHARDNDDQTALHLATWNGNAEVAALLLDAGADVDSRESSGQMTPLLIASLQGDVDLVKLLVGAGADIEAASANGRTPFFFSASMESFSNVGSGNLIRYFAANGADTSPEDGSGITPLEWAKRRNVPAYREIVDILTDLGVER